MELVIAIVVGVLVSEAYAWLPKILDWLIERAVSRLPTSDQERCREEWNANLDALPNTIVKFVHALSFGYARAADKISNDFFEAKFNEMDCVLKSLSDKHRCNMQAMRIFTVRVAAFRELQNSLEQCIQENVASLKAPDAPIRQGAKPESVQEYVKAFEVFCHVLAMAINRACNLTTLKFEKLCAKTDQADSLVKTVLEKHSHTNKLFRTRNLPSRDLALALENLKDDLERLRVMVEGDVVDDEQDARDVEHKEIIAALQIATSPESWTSLNMRPRIEADGDSPSRAKQST